MYQHDPLEKNSGGLILQKRAEKQDRNRTNPKIKKYFLKLDKRIVYFYNMGADPVSGIFHTSESSPSHDKRAPSRQPAEDCFERALFSSFLFYIIQPETGFRYATGAAPRRMPGGTAFCGRRCPSE